MQSESADGHTNGDAFGAVERSNDPTIPRLGEGNRVSADPQPSVMAPPPEQFGRGVTEQRREAPKDKKDKRSKDGEDGEKKDQASADKDQDEKGGGEKDKKEGNGSDDEKDEKKKPQGPPFYKRPVLMAILICVLLILIIGGILFWLHARQFEGTDDAFVDGHVTPISPQVAALVQDVKVDDNYLVKQGQLLVQLDPRNYESALHQAQANESSMRGKLAQAKSMVEVNNAGVIAAQADVTVAEVNFANADLNFKRYQALDSRARTQQQLDNVTAEERGNQAQVEQAKARLAQAQAQVTSAQSQIEVAQGDVDKAVADVQQAQLNLSYCTIVSPQDGYITRKMVEPGSYVQIGQVLFSTVPTNVWVTANFKETQLDLMRPGQQVDIHVDAYPDKTFHGKVDSIEAGTGSRFSLLPPENATGNYVKVVQRVPVKIVIDEGDTHDRDHILGPGMSVEPEVKVR